MNGDRGGYICGMKHYGGELEQPTHRLNPANHSGDPVAFVKEVLCMMGCGLGFVMCTEHLTWIEMEK